VEGYAVDMGDMLVPDNNRVWTTYNQILDRVADEDYPIRNQQPNETAPKQSKNALEEVHFRSPERVGEAIKNPKFSVPFYCTSETLPLRKITFISL
jgi:hypothetical protein